MISQYFFICQRHIPTVRMGVGQREGGAKSLPISFQTCSSFLTRMTPLTPLPDPLHMHTLRDIQFHAELSSQSTYVI